MLIYLKWHWIQSFVSEFFSNLEVQIITINHWKMKLGIKYNLLDTPCILKYKQIYWSKYLQSVEWSKYLHYQPLFTRYSCL